jgi:hypothetical protein
MAEVISSAARCRTPCGITEGLEAADLDLEHAVETIEHADHAAAQ